ncbi:efflux protein [Coccidioides immitis RMSCC 2394]|uniref:Efflux protein n=1 Tax=Coccidioides immitis RMSCC 2394 TaxID=404692 RepID=A0A0J7AWE2_COCIT|nr:efflux protein [Coccidioides immitis RMSCC 2394]
MGTLSTTPSDGSSVSTVELRSLSPVPVEPARHKGRRVSDVQNECAAIPDPTSHLEPQNRLHQPLRRFSFLNVMGSGILIAALPRIAKDVSISEGLILWPAAVYSLAAGCLLLMFGAVADIIGPKLMWVTGSFLFVAFTVAVSAARTGLQVILFRTCLGVAISMCLPTAVSLIANTFPKILGGIFTDTIGWRWAYNMMSLALVHHHLDKKLTRRLIEDVDWLAYLVARVELRTLGVISALITMIALVLMATVDIDEDYWLAPFWALLFSPVNPDMLFTLSNLVISDSFPADIQSLAGGVFNGVSQFGNSVGLAATAAIVASVTEHSDINLSHKELVMKGYRSAFWTIFAATTLVVIISFFGLRKGGTVGKKDE